MLAIASITKKYFSLATLNPLTMLTNSATGFESVTSAHENTFHDNSSIDDEKEACRDIICDFEATCELGPDKYPRCTCQFDCETASLAAAKPVCASDFRIYSTICAMKMEACQRQEELRLRPLDLCQGSEFISTLLIFEKCLISMLLSNKQLRR